MYQPASEYEESALSMEPDLNDGAGEDFFARTETLNLFDDLVLDVTEEDGDLPGIIF